MIRKLQKLTRRELDILRLIGEGNTTAQMARELYISVETVRTHRKRILSKTKAKSMITVIITALRADMIDITTAG